MVTWLKFRIQTMTNRKTHPTLSHSIKHCNNSLKRKSKIFIRHVLTKDQFKAHRKWWKERIKISNFDFLLITALFSFSLPTLLIAIYQSRLETRIRTQTGPFFWFGFGGEVRDLLKNKVKNLHTFNSFKILSVKITCSFFWVSFYYMYKKVLAASILEYQVGGFDISGGVRYCPVRSWPAIVHSVHDFWCPLYLYSILRRLNKQPPTLPA